MPNCAQVAGAGKEQVITGAGKKGFFRRIAERMGLAQREVAECRGKSLREMAEMTSKKDTVTIGNCRYTLRTKEDAEALVKIAEAKRRGIDTLTSEIGDIHSEIHKLRETQALNLRWANEIEANADFRARRILQTRYGDNFIHRYGQDYVDEYQSTLKSIDRLKQELKECHGIGEAYKEDNLVIQSSRGLHEYHDLRATIYSQEQKLQSLEKYHQEYLNEVSKLKQEVLEDKKVAEQIENKIKELEDVISTKERQVAQERKEVEDFYAQARTFYN